jgi:hypothetical protein
LTVAAEPPAKPCSRMPVKLPPAPPTQLLQTFPSMVRTPAA